MNYLQMVIIYIVIMAVVLGPTYFTNKKKKQKQQEMINSLKAGDKITTIGGIKGTVVEVLTDTVEIKIDKIARMTILKSAVSSVSQ